jgi:pyruvate carboxylase
LNRLLFPGPTREFATVRETFGDVSVLDTVDYLYGLRAGEEHVIELERGVRLIAGLEAVGDVDERGMRTVMCTLNGQMRPIRVRDRSVSVTVRAAERADPSAAGQIAAPFSGVVSLAVDDGAEVALGQTVATIEAMKMEASITSPVAGRVTRFAIGAVQQVEGGDLLMVIN